MNHIDHTGRPVTVFIAIGLVLIFTVRTGVGYDISGSTFDRDLSSARERGTENPRGYLYAVALLTNDTDMTVQWPSDTYSEIPFQVMNTGKLPDSYTFEVDPGISPFSGWTAPSETDMLMPGETTTVYLRLLPPMKVTTLTDVSYEIKVKCISTTNSAIFDTAIFRAVLDTPGVEIKEMSMRSTGITVGDGVRMEVTLRSDRAVENLTIIVYGNDNELVRRKGISLEDNKTRTVILSFRARTEGPYEIRCVVDLNGVNLTSRESTVFVDERHVQAGEYLIPAGLILAAVAITVAIFWRVNRGKN